MYFIIPKLISLLLPYRIIINFYIELVSSDIVQFTYELLSFIYSPLISTYTNISYANNDIFLFSLSVSYLIVVFSDIGFSFLSAGKN